MDIPQPDAMINNTRDNSKYLRSDIIHKEEDPDTMDL
jgi:hypothetical protein